MASIFIVRVPGWRTLVIQTPESWHLFDSAVHWYRRTMRSRLFREIERGNDQQALKFATRRRLAWSRGEWGETPLCAAISHGRSELACELIRRGGVRPKDGALASAAASGDMKIVQALLAAGKNPDEPFPENELHGMTPLMYATNRGHLEVMQALLAAGANIDAVDDSGTSAAMHARSGTPGHLRALEVLLPYKPDIHQQDDRKRNLIREAIDRYRCSDKPAMLLLLKAHYPEIDFDAYLASMIAHSENNQR